MQLPQTLYITDATEDFENLSWVHELHKNGVNWILLRLDETYFYENHPESHFLVYFHEKADQLKAICEALGMLFSVWGDYSVALFSQADGIHFISEQQMTAQLAGQETDLLVGISVQSETLRQLDANVANYTLLIEEENKDEKVEGISIPVYQKDSGSNTWRRF